MHRVLISETGIYNLMHLLHDGNAGAEIFVEKVRVTWKACSRRDLAKSEIGQCTAASIISTASPFPPSKQLHLILQGCSRGDLRLMPPARPLFARQWHGKHLYGPTRKLLLKLQSSRLCLYLGLMERTQAHWYVLNTNSNPLLRFHEVIGVSH